MPQEAVQANVILQACKKFVKLPQAKLNYAV